MLKSIDKMSLNIRLAAINDLDDIKSCIHNAFIKYVPMLGGRPSVMDTDFLPFIEKNQLFVATIDNAIVATSVITSSDTYFLMKHVAVDEMHQKQGIGKKLVSFAEKMALKKSASSLHIYTNAALPELVTYWSEIGFKESKQIPENGHVIVYMTKALNL